MNEKIYTPIDEVVPVRIYGQIIGPMNNPEAYTTIILKAVTTNWEVIQDTTSTTQTDQNGNYDFSVYPGKYAVFFERRGLKKRVNDIQVYSDSQPGPLQNFMLTPTASDLTPLIVRQTIAAAELVNGKAVIAVEAAISAKNSASEAKADAEAADASAASAASDSSSASQSADSAESSATSASSDEALAHKWADNPEDVVVANGEFSSFHWAQKAKEAVSNGTVISITAGDSYLTPDPVGNINLGSSATLDATTSTTDNTVGRVLKVGDRGIAATGAAAIVGFDFNTYIFAASETLLIDMSKAINVPGELSSLSTSYVYLNVTGVRDALNGYAFTLNEYFNKETWFCIRENDAGTVGWVIAKLPTIADDVLAIPSTIRGTISDNGSFASAGASGFWLVNVQNPDTVAGFPKDQNGNYLYTYGIIFVTSDHGNPWQQTYYANNGHMAWRQAWTPGPDTTTTWIAPYSPVNPQDLSAYITAAAAYSTFLQGVNYGAVTQVAVSGNQYMASSGCVLCGLEDNDSSIYPAFDSVDAIYQKSTQVNINGNWFVVQG